MTVESGALKRLGERLGLDESKGYAIAVAVVLVFAGILVGGYFAYRWATGGPAEGYATVHLLSSDRTLDLPETVVLGRNSTFGVWVTVENHMRKTLSFEIRIKITGEADPTFPVNAEPKSVYSMTLDDGGKWEQLSTISIDSIGRHMVVFELWSYSGGSVAEFTDKACVLNIEAIGPS